MAIKVTHGTQGNIQLVPGVPTKLGFTLEAAPPATPKGMVPVGYLRVHERSTGVVALRVPIEIGE